MKRVMSIPFLRLWVGSTASGLATWALPFVLGLAAVEGLISSGELGTTLAVRTLGFLIAVPFGGVLSDRTGPRKVILVSGLIGCLSIPLMVFGLFTSSLMGAAALLVGAATNGIGQGACRPAYQAIVPVVVPAQRLQSANAAMSISVRITSLAGPALISFIAMSFGTGAAMAAISCFWLVSAVAPPEADEANNTGASHQRRKSLKGFMVDFWSGVEEARRHPWFFSGLGALTVVIAVGYSVTTVLLPGISQDISGGAGLMTATTSSYLLGALVGALLTARFEPPSRGWVALFGLGLYGLVPFSLLAADNITVPIAAYFVAGIGTEIFNVPWFTAVQKEIPADRLSRVSSLDFLCSYGLAPLGLTMMAPLVVWLGRDTILVGSGVVCLLVPALAAFGRTARYFSAKVPGARP